MTESIWFADKVHGAEVDGGRLMSKALSQWLSMRRNNDVKVIVHGLQVSIEHAYYDTVSDTIVLVPLVDEDYRIAVAHCPEELERP